MKSTFVKFIRNSESYFKLIKKRPSAFVLLSLIAIRARRTSEKNLPIDLEIGGALIGDHDTYKVTEAVYRTDKKYLEKNGFIVTTKTNRRGTIVKLINKDIFDICPETIPSDNTSNKRNISLEKTNNTIEHFTGDQIKTYLPHEEDNKEGKR